MIRREAFPMFEDEILEGFHFEDDYDPRIHQQMLLLILFVTLWFFSGPLIFYRKKYSVFPLSLLATFVSW